MVEAYIVDYIRTPFGRFGGALSSVRPDDLAAHVVAELMARQASVAGAEIDDVIFGCANQAGEDNRNVARMALLLAGLPESVTGITVNRLCASGMDAVAAAARQIKAGEADLIVAGGVENMSRAPFVLPKASAPFSRDCEIFDTTIGWRFVNPRMKARHGVDSMPETAENVATFFKISRSDQDAFAFRSQMRAASAREQGRFAREIAAVPIKLKKGPPILVEQDEHPRPDTTLEALGRLPAPFRAEGGTVTAGNSSGVNDGAAALLIASGRAVKRHGLTPKARIVGAAAVGVAPRMMGFGPAPASRKLMDRFGLGVGDFDTIEINEAFAAQVLAVTRDLGLPDDCEQVNPDGGAIALGHPLGASGARLIGAAALRLAETGRKRALVAMCVGVGQGVALALEAV